MSGLSAFIAGFLFAVGLSISEMTNANKVKGFLNVFGNWNYSLVIVLFSAAISYSLIFYFSQKKSKPLLSDKYFLPEKKSLDLKLILGGVIFGAGWGWTGLCPGPAVASLITLKFEVWTFFVAVICGIWFFQFCDKNFK